MDRPTPAQQQQNTPGLSSATSNTSQQFAPVPMEEDEIDSRSVYSGSTRMELCTVRRGKKFQVRQKGTCPKNDSTKRNKLEPSAGRTED